MQNDIKTKSTDFLPGKPSIDSVAKSPISQPNTDENLKPVAGPASAHVIDLKKASVSPVDSPLLNHSSDNSDELEKPASITPEFDGIQKNPSSKSDIVVKPKMDEPIPDPKPVEAPTGPVSPSSAEEPNPATQEKTDINSINLTDPSTHPETANTEDKPKKSSKLKWLLLAVLFIIVGAAVAVGVIYALNTLAI